MISEISDIYEKEKDELEARIKELEEENVRLKIAVRTLNEKLSTCNRRLNRSIEDTHNDITHDRDDR